MYIPSTEHTLIARLRTGELNFARFTELLSGRGFITQHDTERGLGFGRSELEAIGSANGNEIFCKICEFLLPDAADAISISCHATDEGGQNGSFSYAIFNRQILDRKEIHKILMEENRMEFIEFQNL